METEGGRRGDTAVVEGEEKIATGIATTAVFRLRPPTAGTENSHMSGTVDFQVKLTAPIPERPKQAAHRMMKDKRILQSLIAEKLRNLSFLQAKTKMLTVARGVAKSRRSPSDLDFLEWRTISSIRD